MRSIRLLAVAAGLAGVLAAGAQADQGTRSGLTAIAGQGTGLVTVSPTAHDVLAPNTFDVQGTINVHDAAPNTTFAVLRRVDRTANGVCTGPIWMPLPSPTPDLITSAGGAGALHFEIMRGDPFVDGVHFDVQWRLEGNDGSILQGNCFTVTVK
jgi:hypothetical protein